MMKRAVVSALALGLISACGGGGGGSSAAPSDPPSSPPPPTSRSAAIPSFDSTNFAIFSDNAALSGQSVSLALAAKNGLQVESIQWAQTAGPEVAILAERSQVIGFDAIAVGDYTFSLSAQLSNGERIEDDVELTVTEPEQAVANVRLDHAVSERGKVSLRVDGQAGKTISTISWEQSSGPDVSNQALQDNFLFFDAPTVTRDTVVEFVATVRYTDGSEAADLGRVVIKNVDINDAGYFPNSGLANQVVTTDMFAYRADSPYANAMQQCIYNNQVSSSCRFSLLPLIGTVTPDPAIEDILDRVLVSHNWMGERFEEYLRTSAAAPDMLKLLRATTAVVISYDVRPSFYWSATGAIYLDANNFWVTPQERDTLNDQPDFRSDFGNDLNFVIPWRYVLNNDYYFRSSQFPYEERASKAFDDLEASLTWLMYHELGHANDFFPPTSWAGISEFSSPLAYSNDSPPNSERFANLHGLTSGNMRALAQVSFAGNEPNQTQINYAPLDVADFFEPDNAPAYYSYFNVREDYATLFERFMMLYRLGVSADVAVTGLGDTNFQVVWGQRDRISEAKMLPRIRTVINDILPELDVDTIHATFPDPLLMTPGRDWFDNIVLSPEQTALNIQRSRPAPLKLTREPVLQGHQHRDMPRPTQ